MDTYGILKSLNLGRLTEQDIKLMIKDVERYNQEDQAGQMQSTAGFKMWSHNKKAKGSKDPKQIAAPADASTSHNSDPILTALPQPD